MKYGTIKWNDIADGLGVRVALYVSGCRRHCQGCQNPETWNFDYGQEFTEETKEKIIQGLSPKWIQGLSILGGEPLEPENQFDVLNLLRQVRSTYGSSKDIWLYTGGTLEKLWADDKYYTREIISLIDVLVDGAFEMSLRDPGLDFRGSSNQRILTISTLSIHR